MEDVFIVGIVITGMVLTYKLLSQLIKACSRQPVTAGADLGNRRGRGRRHRSRAEVPPPPPPPEEPTESYEELLERAREMQRRIETLEAIISSEHDKEDRL